MVSLCGNQMRIDGPFQLVVQARDDGIAVLADSDNQHCRDASLAVDPLPSVST